MGILRCDRIACSYVIGLTNDLQKSVDDIAEAQTKDRGQSNAELRLMADAMDRVTEVQHAHQNLALTVNDWKCGTDARLADLENGSITRGDLNEALQGVHDTIEENIMQNSSGLAPCVDKRLVSLAEELWTVKNTSPASVFVDDLPLYNKLNEGMATTNPEYVPGATPTSCFDAHAGVILGQDNENLESRGEEEREFGDKRKKIEGGEREKITGERIDTNDQGKDAELRGGQDTGRGKDTGGVPQGRAYMVSTLFVLLAMFVWIALKLSNRKEETLEFFSKGEGSRIKLGIYPALSMDDD